MGRKYLDALCVYFWATTPVLISILTFTTYVALGHHLTAAKVCVAMGYGMHSICVLMFFLVAFLIPVCVYVFDHVVCLSTITFHPGVHKCGSVQHSHQPT